MQDYNFNDCWWLVVPKFNGKDEAIKRFIERFGRQPDQVRQDHQLYWIGPAPRSANERNSEDVCEKKCN